MALIYGSSMTNPNYTNYKGSQTYNPRSVTRPQTVYGSSQTNPAYTNYRGGAAVTNRSGFQENGQVLNVSTGGVSGSGNPSPQPNQPTVPTVDPLLQQIDSAYGERIGKLDNIAAILRGELPRAEQDVNSQFGVQEAQLNATRDAGVREIDTAQADAGLRQEDAMSSARRQYNDLIRGGIQRFGGASSAGGAYSEIAATEAQRQFGDTRKTYETAMQKIAEQRQGLTERHGAAMLQLKAVRDNALNMARRDLDNKLIEIERMKDEAGAAKSDRRLAILQEYRDNIFNINQQMSQFKNQLDQEMQKGSEQLVEFQTLAQQYGQGAQDSSNLIDTNTSLDVPIEDTQDTQSPQAYVGSINKKEDVLASARRSLGLMS